MSEKICIERCGSYDKKKVRRAVEAGLRNIGFDLSKFRKKRVLIKPNLLSAAKPEEAITTHPAVVEALCKILKENNCHIVIGDSSGAETDSALRVCGMSKMRKYGEVVNFENYPKKTIKIKKSDVKITNLDFDLIINVAKMKTHILTDATLCVKNLYGLIPGKAKQYYHRLFLRKRDFADFLVELALKINPGLNIVEGITGLEGNGPGRGGRAVRTGVIVFGKNCFDVDRVAGEVMGFRKGEIITDKIAWDRKERETEIVGSGKEIRKKYKRAGGGIKSALKFLSFFGKPGIYFNKNKCVKCRLCMKNCPVNAIKVPEFPVCDYGKCINCFCCIEICPENAVELRENFVLRTIKKIKNKLRKNPKH
jgi:uncharacterized protein (DUF362 family)/Pyruvate/2-oxoacid:ferredoxin oxidoreductase delta subunit